MLGYAFQNVEISPGETKALGDVTPARPETDEAQPQDAAKAEAVPPSLEIEGHVTDEKGQPIAGANMTLTADSQVPWQGGIGGTGMAVLANATTDQTGGYRLSVQGATSKNHRSANLLVRKEGLALAWKDVNLDKTRITADFQLGPEEPLRGKLIDVEGQPASGVRLVVQSVIKREDNRPLATGIAYKGHADRAPAWIAPVTSDKEGRFTIPGVPKGYGVFIEVDGGERFAPQEMAISTGLPEQRSEKDGTYRSQVKNAQLGEEVTLVLPPAQMFEGRVTYEDTGEPAPFAGLRMGQPAETRRLDGFGLRQGQCRRPVSDQCQTGRAIRSDSLSARGRSLSGPPDALRGIHRLGIGGTGEGSQPDPAPRRSGERGRANGWVRKSHRGSHDQIHARVQQQSQ